MSDENVEQAGFAAWAATEGITNVVFSPVTAVGRTLGNVSGQRDHHLVLLDREWGIWQAARASRPREAGMYVQQVPFKGCACAGCLAGDPLHHPYLCETCYAKVVPAPKWEAT